MQKRILIVINDDGTGGISATDETGKPQPIDSADLNALAPDINAALTASNDAKDKEHADEIEKLNTEHKTALDALNAKLAEALNPPARETIANWRAKAVLALAGLTADAESAIDALDDPQRTVIRAAWDGDAEFARDGQTVTALAASLGLSDEQLDGMFAQATALEV
jgi:predicted ribonuclease toxin of YeeF-YezG toxin-antitoxin module